jgi:hypothetical protein
LVTGNEVSLVANAEVKVGKLHNTEVGTQVFGKSKYFGTTEQLENEFKKY